MEGWPYDEIWLADFGFDAPPGERPSVACLVAIEFKSGKVIRLWQHELGPEPPYRTDERVLFVAFFATAELGCHLALGWPRPANVLDLFAEFRTMTNGVVRG